MPAIPLSARVVAFYLPQFHPIAENDEWWGKGFTEWTNAAKARPLFRGHRQPDLPGELGFYDLRLAEVRHAQAALARQYGIEAFCYYYYWFAGKRLLERPLNEVIESGKPDLPYCLCWANASWTGVWHGEPHRVLIEQTYPGARDYESHFGFLLKAFRDPRYLRVEGKPVYVVHRPLDIPDVRRVMELFRSLAAAAGLEGLHLVGVTPHQVWDPKQYGLDALVVQRMPALNGHVPWRYPSAKLKAKLRGNRLTVLRYADWLGHLITPHTARREYYPCLLPNWDNTPRSGMNGLVLEGSTPGLFRRHVREAVTKVREKPWQHRLVFLKSWNEWAEGNHVEPDARFGRGYLEALRAELSAAATDSASFDERLAREGEPAGTAA